MFDKYEYFTKFNWSHNPFTLTVSPELMVGYSSQIESILFHIFNSHKVALVIGPTGSGKTTLLNWASWYIEKEKKNYNVFYVPKPPTNEKGLILLMRHLLKYGIFDRFHMGKLNLNNLPKILSKKTRKKKTVLLIDEAHECPIEILEWFRTLNDMTPNTILIFAGLSTFEEIVQKKLPTLFMRATTKVYLKSLTKPETESLIRKRIEKAGGEELKPFTPDAASRIFELTGGFPREIIKTCDELVKMAVKKNIPTINQDFVDEILKTSEITEPVELKIILSKKQKEIIYILNEHPNFNPSEIVDHLNIKKYKNRDNAIRSVNNILKRLMKEGLINRKKIRNTYIYSLSGKAKTFLAKA